MGNLIRIAAVLFAVLATATELRAQKVGVKTNVLYWATGTVNFGAEIAVAPKVTLDIVGTSNIPGLIYFGDKALNRKLWHWMVQPEARYWFTEAFSRGFVGLHATGGAFDAGGIKLPWGILPDFKDHRYEGGMGGLGVSFGWQWYLSPHWNLEATLGFGYLYLKYNRFEDATSSFMDEIGKVKHYFGPTRIGASFMYLFGSKK